MTTTSRTTRISRCFLSGCGGPWCILWLACAVVLVLLVEHQSLYTATTTTSYEDTFTADLDFLRQHLPPEGQLPHFINQRYRDGRRARKVQAIGYRVLQQYGSILRKFFLDCGSSVSYHPSYNGKDNNNNNSTTRTGNNKKCRQRLQTVAPWFHHHDSPHNMEWPLDQLHVHSDYNTNNNSTHPMAILVSAGDRQLAYLQTMLYTVRELHSSHMPMYISYRGNDDLSPASRETLRSQFTNVQFIDIAQQFHCDLYQLHGWNLRFFGVLLVPAQQVLVLDADVMMLQPPENFFTILDTTSTGAVLFHDRVFPERMWQPRLFLQHLQSTPTTTSSSQQAMSLLQYQHGLHKEHVQESGVILLDKRLPHVRNAIWMACALLGHAPVRRFAQWDLVYGDKEFYWTALELVQDAPYSFSSYYPGVLGGVVAKFEGTTLLGKHMVSETLEVASSGNMEQQLQAIVAAMNHSNTTTTQQHQWALCGRLLHFDEQGVPLWSNGGYLTKDDDRNSRHGGSSGLIPVLYADGGRFPSTSSSSVSPPQVWKLHPTLGVEGLVPPQDSRGIQRVPASIRQVAEAAVDYYLLASWSSFDQEGPR